MTAWLSKIDAYVPLRYAAWVACAVGFAISLWLELTLSHGYAWFWLVPLAFGVLVLLALVAAVIFGSGWWHANNVYR